MRGATALHIYPLTQVSFKGIRPRAQSVFRIQFDEMEGSFRSNVKVTRPYHFNQFLGFTFAEAVQPIQAHVSLFSREGMVLHPIPLALGLSLTASLVIEREPEDQGSIDTLYATLTLCDKVLRASASSTQMTRFFESLPEMETTRLART